MDMEPIILFSLTICSFILYICFMLGFIFIKAIQEEHSHETFPFKTNY